MRRQILILGCALLVPCNAMAAEDLGDVTEAVNFFGNCAGVWDFMSDAMVADGKPAAAEQMRNTGNGAQTAALWILASKHNLDTGNATTYGSWMDLVRPRRENGRLRMHALVEIEDLSTIEAEAGACFDALGDQENILQLMRQDRVRQAQSEHP